MGEETKSKSTDSQKQLDAKEFLDKIGSYLGTNIDTVRFLLDSAADIIKPDDYELRSKYLIIEAAYYWYTSRLDTSLIIFRQNLALAEEHQLQKSQLLLLSNMGALFNLMGKPDSAMVYLRKALDKAAFLNDSSSMGKVHFDLGIYYNRKEYSHLALDHLQQAMGIFEHLKDSLRVCYVYNSLVNTYQNIGDFDKTIYFSNKSIEYDLALPQINMLSDLYNNLGVTYWKLKQDYPEARKYFRLSIELANGREKNARLYTYLVNLGGMEIKAGDPEKGFKYLNQAKKIELPFLDDYKTSALLVNLGMAYTIFAKYDSAYICISEGLNLAKKIEAYEQISIAYEGLYQLDSITGNFRSALNNYAFFEAATDSMNNIDHRNKIAELDIIYESKQKEQENFYLKTENELQEKVIAKQKLVSLVIGLGMFLILFILFFLWRNWQKLKTANSLLEKRNAEVEDMNSLIQIKNKNLEEQKDELVLLNQTKDKFFSVIAHDLKNPFNSLLGFLEILDSDFAKLGDNEKMKIIKSLLNNSRNTYNMLVNLLDWARSQRGQILSKPQKLHLYDSAKSAIEFLKQRIDEKGHQVQLLIPVHETVFADSQLIQTILINIINNSVKFTQRGGSIIISSERLPLAVVIMIKDNGMGISQETNENLFTLNSKMSRRGTENELGTGLGLIMCKEFADLMHGSIRVESEEGKGSVFYVTLPCNEN